MLHDGSCSCAIDPNDAADLPGISSGRRRMLAYSCAAARDLHPLPILVRADKDTRIVNVEKEPDYEQQTITGGGEEVK